ncbi:MAG: DUF3365 domain-containing protein [Coriobacteriales bacterium]|jgi:signal transduction histidine kinase|nr:DUF3365 domain-containing protein [Coriobacteriales bacterium]
MLKSIRENNLKIHVKITILLVILLVVSVAFNVIANTFAQRQQAEKEMLEKTQILDQEMRAVWDFIDINQSRIDTDANGNYNFKNIYCAIAGKSVAKLFMLQNDYEIRYVSFTPRYSSAYPDEFEAKALDEFAISEQNLEYYDITALNERDVFRYASPIRIKESCLSCHGEPAGEKDITGHSKEGLKVGDIAGAMSIVMPIDLYMEGIQSNIWLQSVYFAIVLGTLIIIAYLGISLLVKRLEHTNERLKTESQYKSDFLATMSHEFRTPLTAILAFAELWERSPTPKSERDIEAISEVRENGKLLLNMVNNILEVARTDSGKVEMNYEITDMVDLISTIEGALRPLAERRDIRFITTVDADVPLINADWEKLRRIVENLVSNAIKFTQRGGEVDVSVSLVSEDSTQDNTQDRTQSSARIKNGIAIAVRDTGIGIKAEELDHVFEKFVQLDKSSFRRYNGSGLGLTVVKELTEAHGGTITVASEPKRGSTFTIYIPADKDMQSKE